MPIAYKGTYHYRSGSTKQELKGLALQQFIMEKMGHSWDDIPVYGATLDDIDRNAIDYFCNVASRQVVWMNQRLIRRPKMYCVILACLPGKVN